MSHSTSFDGDNSIEQTEQSCEVEQNAGLQLTKIQFGTVLKDGKSFPVNKADFDIKTIGRLKNLSFTEVKEGDDPTAIRKNIENEGWTFICDTQIYVSNIVTRVIVAGKKSF